MYHAKERGGGSYQFYSEERNLAVVERLEFENGLHRALERSELALYYQPQLDLRSGTIVGAEALLRWNHPQRGLILPLKFLPAAVESGQIVTIGEWVLESACRQTVEWQRSGLAPMRIAVNLAAAQFLRPTLAATVERVINETGLEASLIDLEITEDALMVDMDRTCDTLMVLSRYGVRLTLDDFGTGYSSLNYLKRFPIDALKIDRTFVSDINPQRKGSSIVSTIIALAHNLGLDAVAEGVETQEQLDYLRDEGCDEIQGFLLGEPLPAGEFAKKLQTEFDPLLRLDPGQSLTLN